jgi:hypothetical protein
LTSTPVTENSVEPLRETPQAFWWRKTFGGGVRLEVRTVANGFGRLDLVEWL